MPAPESAAAVVVEVVEDASTEVVEAIARLLPQLSSAAPPGAAEIGEIVRDPATTLLVARDERSQIVGSLTLALFRIPTGLRAWIEDVVVDESARGKGVGERLNEAALEIARRRGVRTVELTSRPSRAAANRLYQRMGFVQRETNLYRISLEP